MSNRPIVNMQMVPYIAHESDMVRMERTNRRLWILCLFLIFMLVATNFGWLVYEKSFTDITITQENEDGYNNYIGNDGDITNGKTDY